MTAQLPPVVARLVANISEFTGPMQKARAEMAETEAVGKSRLGALGTAFGGMSGVAATGMAVAGAAVLAFGVHAAGTFENTGKEVLKLTRLTGETPEAMSKLRFAAQQSGVDADRLANSLKFLSKAMVGGSDAFKTLGVSTQDANGHLRSGSEVMLDVADRFAKMENGAEKNALALKLFGRAGLEMLPMLNKGRDGLMELEAEAQKYGLVLTGSNLAAVQQSIQAHREFDAAMQGLQIQIGAHVLPVLTALTEFLAKLPGPIKDIGGPLVVVGGGLLVFAGVGLKVVQMLSPLASAVKGVVTNLRDSSAASSAAGAGLSGYAAAAGVALAGLAAAYGIWEAAMHKADEQTKALGNQIKDRSLTDGYDRLKQRFADINGQIDGLSNTIKNSHAPWDADYRAELSHTGAELEKQNEHIQGLISRTDEMSSATGRSKEEVLKWLQSEEKAGRTYDSTGGALQAMTGQTYGYASSADDAGRAATSQSDAIKGLAEQLRASTDPVFAAQKAQDALSKAQWDVVTATFTYGADSPEVQAANRANAEAASGYNAALLTLQQGVVAGTISQDQFTATLQTWVTQGWISQGQADQLSGSFGGLSGQAQTAAGNVGGVGAAADGINGKSARVSVSADTAAAMWNLVQIEIELGRIARNAVISLAASGSLPGYASGGSVDDGWFMVGEKGPELGHKSGSTVDIFPTSTSRQMTAAAGGGSTVNVVVNMPPGANGEDVVDAIRRYERVNGQQWRTARV